MTMLRLLLDAVLAAAVLHRPQTAPPPIFRAQVDVVPITVAVARGNAPDVELTAADFTIILDKKTYVPVDVTQLADKPGCYFINFTPPPDSLNGKPHRLGLKVKNHSPKWTMVVWAYRPPPSWTSGRVVPVPKRQPLLDTFACRTPASMDRGGRL